jgi:hypothetical protein
MFKSSWSKKYETHLIKKAGSGDAHVCNPNPRYMGGVSRWCGIQATWAKTNKYIKEKGLET